MTYLISRFSVVNPDGKEIAKTFVKNEFKLAYEPSGTNGFGYDKILIPGGKMLNDFRFRVADSDNNEYSYAWSLTEDIYKNNKTIAELEQEDKNAICNRGRIAKYIRETLDNKDKKEN